MANLNYVSLSDLKDVLPEQEQAEATDDNSPATTEPENLTRDDDMVERYLQMAESRVETYLTGYTLPLNDPPFAIRWAVLVVASYMLLTRADLSVSDDVDRMYGEVLNWLREIQAGDAQVPRTDEDDEDFVGFADQSTMLYDSFPHRRFQSFL